MSSVVSFGTNTNAQRKRVKWYNRESSAETLYEGQPVCYLFDTTTNILGIDTGAANAASTTTTEGGQNEGKFLIVEKPYTDNLQWFAGVVAHGSWCGTSVAATSYKWIEIFIPNGAIVPARCDIDTTAAGRSILSLEDDSQELTYLYSSNYTSRPVGIAVEDVVGTTGTPLLCLVKLDPNLFICQDLSTSSSLIIAPSGSASCALNRINVTNAATSGEMGVFEIKSDNTGGVNSPWGLCAYFRARQYGAMTDRACAFGVAMAMESGGSTTADLLSALRVKLVANTGSTISACHNVNVLNLEADLDVTAPARCSWIHCGSIGTNAPNFFIDALDAGDLSDATVTTADITSQDSSSDRNIPIRLGATTYYLRAFVTA